MARQQNKTKLSKSILEMKFMKRTKEKVDKELEDTEGRDMYSHEITTEMRQGAGSFVIEPSYVFCEDLLVGRLSFRGMNPEIERIMELENAELTRESEKRGETEVSDYEMAAFYNPLVQTINSKFKKQSQPPQSGPAPQWKGKHKRGFSPEEETKKRVKLDDSAQKSNDSPSAHHKSKKQKFMRPQDV